LCVQVRGDRLLIANPLNLKLVKAFPKSVVEEAWNELWQVELIQKDKFNLSFLACGLALPMVALEVLLASFTLQIFGLTPIITQVIIDKVLVQKAFPPWT